MRHSPITWEPDPEILELLHLEQQLINNLELKICHFLLENHGLKPLGANSHVNCMKVIKVMNIVISLLFCFHFRLAVILLLSVLFFSCFGRSNTPRLKLHLWLQRLVFMLH